MNNTIKCIAIDDEPLALDVIDKFCKRAGNITLKTFTDPQAGLEAIMHEKPSIVFLDIEMDNINGLTIASRLPATTCFIFTTAYLDYAMEGFELDAVDYLHKPFAYSRFLTALSKARRRIGLDNPSTPSPNLLVKHDYNTVSIPLSDISYIEAMEGYVKIMKDNRECITSRVILKNIGAQLPSNDFVRIHRSFIVQKSKIQSFSKRELTLKNGTTLPIGRQYAAGIVNLLS